jgi:hypothetical protein
LLAGITIALIVKATILCNQNPTAEITDIIDFYRQEFADFSAVKLDR